MSEEKKTTVVYGLSFTQLLTLVFIVLKLTKVISWSWWWVLSPLWIPVCLVIILGVIGGIIYAALS